jgi:hypothetical protein
LDNIRTPVYQGIGSAGLEVAKLYQYTAANIPGFWNPESQKTYNPTHYEPPITLDVQQAPKTELHNIRTSAKQLTTQISEWVFSLWFGSNCLADFV